MAGYLRRQLTGPASAQRVMLCVMRCSVRAGMCVVAPLACFIDQRSGKNGFEGCIASLYLTIKQTKEYCTEIRLAYF